MIIKDKGIEFRVSVWEISSDKRHFDIIFFFVIEPSIDFHINSWQNHFQSFLEIN